VSLEYLPLIGIVAVLALRLRSQHQRVKRLEGAQRALRVAQERQQLALAVVGSTRRLVHELNNVLGMIAGHGELLCRAVPAGDPRRNRADQIVRATLRASEVTRQLLEMARTIDDPKRSSVAPVVPSPEEPPTILLVEDEASLREILHEVLTDAGYRVLAAAAAGEALAAVQSHRGPIHLMLTDVNLPGTSGPELASQVKHRHAAAQVLYMSGHTEEIIARRGTPSSDPSLLKKPFTPSTLLDRVNASLGFMIAPTTSRPASGVTA
jgi:CheY-like chemotaxis protein